jgi:hypothetical protein
VRHGGSVCADRCTQVDELDRITKSIEAKLTAPSADDDSVGNLVKSSLP